MFTGIVQKLAQVVDIQDETSLRRLTLRLDELAEGVELGASVAVNGTCLTVTQVQDGAVVFDVIRETLTRTNIGRLSKGDVVNVERSFRVGDEVGGHIVSGHVAGLATLVRIQVCLIPETIARTTLGDSEPGYQANLEVDAQTQAIVDTVERVLSQPEWRQRMASS